MFIVDPSRVRVSGPLTPFKDGFVAELERQGYTPSSASHQMQLMAHLSRWVEREELDVRDFTPAKAELFLQERRAAGYSNHLSSKALAPLLAQLRRIGAAPPPPAAPAPAGPVEELLGRYQRYLILERGFRERTARRYESAVRPFLAEMASPEGLDLSRLSASEVTAFLLDRCRRGSSGTAKHTVSALRSLLGFLHHEGMIERSLLAAVPSVAIWRAAGLPKALEPAEVRGLLCSCDRGTANGRRDFAILTVLSRLGLRAGEVAGLSFDDVDWRAGEIVVCGKGSRAERLPLPADVGEAIAPTCETADRRAPRAGRCSWARRPRTGRSAPPP
ncbi:MAG TPA: site-specific integrase [Candidatus Dormibacteraeota bacterium]|nr:site-specific integrase [Candidatus Dormibacteraeota bacterium]